MQDQSKRKTPLRLIVEISRRQKEALDMLPHGFKKALISVILDDLNAILNSTEARAKLVALIAARQFRTHVINKEVREAMNQLGNNL